MSAWSILVFLIAASQPSAQDEDLSVSRLNALYPVLKEYYEDNQNLPDSLRTLIEEAYLLEEEFLLDPRAPQGEVVKLYPEQAETFRLVAKSWAGTLLTSGEPRGGILYALNADGQVFKEKVDLQKYYGGWGVGEKRSIDSTLLERPSATLGVILVEVPSTEGRPAVLVEQLAPGYYRPHYQVLMQRDFDRNDLRPGDRLLNYDGYQIQSLEEFELLLPQLTAPNPLPLSGPRLEVYRDGKILQRSNVPPHFRYREFFMGASPNPKLMAELSEVAASPMGPGKVDISLDFDKEEVTVSSAKGAWQQAGIQAGDQIMRIAGKPIRYWVEVESQVYAHRAGSKITVDVLRNGSPASFEVVLDSLNEKDLNEEKFWIDCNRYDLEGMRRHVGPITLFSFIDMVDILEGTQTALDVIDEAIENWDDPRILTTKEDLLQYRARIAYRSGDVETAIQDLNRALLLQDTPTGELIVYGHILDVLFESERDSQALQFVDRLAGNAEYRKTMVLAHLAGQYAEEGHFDAARFILNEMMKDGDKEFAMTVMGLVDGMEDISRKDAEIATAEESEQRTIEAAPLAPPQEIPDVPSPTVSESLEEALAEPSNATEPLSSNSSDPSRPAAEIQETKPIANPDPISEATPGPNRQPITILAADPLYSDQGAPATKLSMTAQLRGNPQQHRVRVLLGGRYSSFPDLNEEGRIDIEGGSRIGMDFPIEASQVDTGGLATLDLILPHRILDGIRPGPKKIQYEIQVLKTRPENRGYRVLATMNRELEVNVPVIWLEKVEHRKRGSQLWVSVSALVRRAQGKEVRIRVRLATQPNTDSVAQGRQILAITSNPQELEAKLELSVDSSRVPANRKRMWLIIDAYVKESGKWEFSNSTGWSRISW